MDILDVLGITTIMDSIKKKIEHTEKSIINNNPINYNYRPQYLDEYIGQEQAKDNVRLNIKEIIEQNPVHFLLSGRAGTGKTTLAYIIANHIGFKIHYYIGGTFDLSSLFDFLYLNQESSIPNVLFIDEIHSLKKDVIEMLYPILEDFKTVNDVQIRKFVFIGATTNKFVLIKKYKPLVDRIDGQIELENYTQEDIIKILKQYNQQVYKQEIDEKIYNILSLNSRFTPRIAIQMFRKFVVCKDINRILKANNIVTEGLTNKDIIILKHLEEVKKPVGEETLSIVSGTDKANYHYVIEPYLIEYGYIGKVRGGRILLDKGKQLLQQIKGEIK